MDLKNVDRLTLSQIASIRCLKFDPDGNIWLVGNQKISSLDANLNFRELPDNKFGILRNPWSIEFSDGNILIGDAGLEEIVKFDRNGRRIGSQYTETMARVMEMSKGTLYVLNTPHGFGEQTLDIYNGEGSLNRIPIPGLYDLASRDGIVYAVRDVSIGHESESNRTEVIRIEDEKQTKINIPCAFLEHMAVDPEHRIWLSKTDELGDDPSSPHHNLFVYSPQGEELARLPISLDLRNGSMRFDEQGRLVVAGYNPEYGNRHYFLARYGLK